MAQDPQIQKGYLFEGQVFATMSALNDYRRGPQVKAALGKLTKNDAELVEWLYKNKDDVLGAFGAATIKRVTKSERKQLEKALTYVAEVLAADPKAKFVVDNVSVIAETFKWPGQKRVKEEDKAAAIVTAFIDLTEGNEQLATWLASNEANLVEAFETGVVKREVSEKTLAALAEARAKRGTTKIETV